MHRNPMSRASVTRGFVGRLGEFGHVVCLLDLINMMK